MDAFVERADFDKELLIDTASGLGKWPLNERDKELRPGIYTKSDDVVESLKDLQRFLRRDDPATRGVFYTLADLKIVAQDLVPLIVFYPDEEDVVYNALKVLTFLTMPVDMESPQVARQIVALQDIRAAFLDGDALSQVVALLSGPLERHPRMTEKDALTVQLVLCFLRNLLCVPEHQTAAHRERLDGRTPQRDALLLRFAEDSVTDLLASAAQHAHEQPFRQDASLLLEIIAEVAAAGRPEDLNRARLASDEEALADHRKRAGGGAADASKLGELLRTGATARKALPPARHPRFAGTYVRRGAVGGGGARTVKGDYKAKGEHISHLSSKGKLGAKDERAPPQPPSLLVLKHLAAFADLLLDGGYDVLMDITRQEAEKGLGISRLDRTDYVRFLNVARFFAEYVSRKAETDGKRRAAEARAAAGAGAAAPEVQPADSPFGQITATMGWGTFHLAYTLWTGQIEIPASMADKDWELMHAAVGLLKEMLFALQTALKYGSQQDRRAADRMQRKLMFDTQRETGLLPLLARAMRGFNMKHESARHAQDLVEAVYVVLKTLDRLDECEVGGFVVGRKRRRKRAKAKPKKADGKGKDGGQEKAAGDKEGAAEEGKAEGGKAGDGEPQQEEGEYWMEEPDGADREAALEEVKLDRIKRFRMDLASPVIVAFYTWVLRGYRNNHAFLNHCVLDYFRRLALPDKCNLMPMLWQLSVLRVFEVIINDEHLRKTNGLPHLRAFITEVLREMFARMMYVPPREAREAAAEEPGDADEAASQPGATETDADLEAAVKKEQLRREADIRLGCASMLFVELLFWKSAKETDDLREEYHWREVYERRERLEGRKIKAKFGADLVALKEVAGAESDNYSDSEGEWDVGALAEGAKEARRRNKRGAWPLEREEELKMWWERLKDESKVVDLITAQLASNGFEQPRATVLRKLKELELWQHRPRGVGGPVGSAAGRAVAALLGMKRTGGAEAVAWLEARLDEAQIMWAPSASARPEQGPAAAGASPVSGGEDFEIIAWDEEGEAALKAAPMQRLLRVLGCRAPGVSSPATAAPAGEEETGAVAASEFWRVPGELGLEGLHAMRRVLTAARSEGERLRDEAELERAEKRARGKGRAGRKARDEAEWETGDETDEGGDGYQSSDDEGKRRGRPKRKAAQAMEAALRATVPAEPTPSDENPARSASEGPAAPETPSPKAKEARAPDARASDEAPAKEANVAAAEAGKEGRAPAENRKRGNVEDEEATRRELKALAEIRKKRKLVVAPKASKKKAAKAAEQEAARQGAMDGSHAHGRLARAVGAPADEADDDMAGLLDD
ncbi:unnamed protein product [Pedinophyceae sp. YPF-701]|nr:unnamed protein product [Pedinophyceae sp. YPF-701]